MTSLLKWNTAGAWTDAFPTASVSAVANVNGVLSTSTVVANGAGDIMADLSFINGASVTPTAAAGAALDFYLLPLLHDGTTYAGPTSTSATTTSWPSATYFVGRMVFQAIAGVHAGMIRGIVIPNGTFKWYFVNNTGATTATSSTCQYRTYGYNLNG